MARVAASGSLEISLLRCVAAVSERFLATCVRMRASGFENVTQTHGIRVEGREGEGDIVVGRGEGFRVEWWLEAEVESGRYASLGVQVAWYPSGWEIERAISCGEPGDQEVVHEWALQRPGTSGETVDRLLVYVDEALSVAPEVFLRSGA